MTLEQVLIAMEADPEEILDRFYGNEKLLRKYFGKFCDDQASQQLQALITSENCSELEIAAHSMKGLSATLGFRKLSEACHTLTVAARNGETDQLQKLFESLQEEVERVICLLKQLDE